jgi:RNA polymerase sigma-70 factor (ECF subfamily)
VRLSEGEDQRVVEIRRRLQAAAARVCPPWLRAHADDIVQTALLRVLAAAGKRGEGNPDLASSYLEKAVYSAVVDEIRRQRRRREDPSDEALASISDGGRHDPEERVSARELADGVARCLQALVRPRRLAVTLHLQGHSVPEIASLLRWGTKQAENLTYRGLENLRACLKAKGLAPGAEASS